MPAYAGTAVIAETPGTTSNGMPALAQPTASSEPVAYRNGSPSSSRTTLPPPLAALTTSRARTAWLSGWPSSPSAPSTTSTSARQNRRTNVGVLRLGDDHVGLAEQLDGSHREQPGVAGAGADEGDAADRLGLPAGGLAGCLRACHRTRSPIRSAAPSASSSAARSRPIRAASSRGPVADSRTLAEPSTATTTARRYSSGPCSPSAGFSAGPDRGRAAGLEGGEQGALGGDGEPGRGSSSTSSRAGDRGVLRRRPAHGTRPRAPPGRGRAASGAGRGPR